MAELFTDLSTSYLDSTVSATNHPGAHNAVNSAANLLKRRTDATHTRVFNVENYPYNAVPDEFFFDGVSNASTTFQSATANFVSGDIGKHITILNAGPSALQAYTGVIASITNSTTVVLTTGQPTGRSQSNCRFYIARGGDQTAAIQSAIDACAAAGGGTVYFPGVGYSISGIVQKSRVSLIGAGHRATMLRLQPNSNAPIIRNDYTTNNNAAFGVVRDICLQGARARQSDYINATGLGANYTAGATTLTLQTGTGVNYLPYGTVKLTNPGVNGGAPTWLLYTSKASADVLNVVLNGIEGSTDASFTTASTTVTHPKAHGIYYYKDPPTTLGTNDEIYDLHHRVNNVWFFDIKGDGFTQYGQAATMMNDCAFEYIDNVGIRPSFDSFFNNINVGNIGRMGCVLGRSQIHLNNVTSYFCGGNTASDGHGFFIDFRLPAADFEGMVILTNCTAQDNKAHALYSMAADRLEVSAFGASTNSASSSGTYAAVKLVGTQDSIIQFVSVDRGVITVAGQPSPTQLNALDIDSASAGNQINITHGGTTNNPVGPAIKPGSDISGGNEITIGDVRITPWKKAARVASTANIAPATSPNTTLSAQALTAATTLSVVSASGMRLGDDIVVSPAGTPEVVTIVGISGTTLTIAPPLTSTHANADPVRNISALLVGGTSLSVDGVTVANNDRVFLKDQTDPIQNGLYVASGVGTSVILTRAFDGESAFVMPGGSTIPIQNGTLNKETQWTLTADDPYTVGVTGLRWTRIAPTYGRPTSGGAGRLWLPTGAKIENMPREQFLLAAQTASATGVVRVGPLGVLRAGDSLSSLSFMAVTAGATITNSWAGIARVSDLNVLAISATSTAVAVVNTFKTFSFTATYTADTDIPLYYFMMYQATTVPTFYGMNQAVTALVSGPVIAGTSNTGATTPVSVGATLTALTAATPVLYCIGS